MIVGITGAFEKLGVVAVATVCLAGVTLATSTSAQARYYHRHGGYGAGWVGPAIVLGMAALYFVLTIVSEAIKIHGEKVQNRNRHP